MTVRTVGAAGDYPFNQGGLIAAIAACSADDIVRLIDAGTITLTVEMSIPVRITLEGDDALLDLNDLTTLPKLYTASSIRAIDLDAELVSIRNLQFEGFPIDNPFGTGGTINGYTGVTPRAVTLLENLLFIDCNTCIQEIVDGTQRNIHAINCGRLVRDSYNISMKVFSILQAGGYNYAIDTQWDQWSDYSLGAIYQPYYNANDRAIRSMSTVTATNVSVYRAGAGSDGTAFTCTATYCTAYGYATLVGGGGVDGGNNFSRDPLFVDPANGDFNFQVSSSEINSGTAISGVTIDALGRTLPLGSGWPRGPIDLLEDTTPPTITGWTRTSKNTVVLTFSEDLDETSAETSANYTTSPTQSITATLTDTNEVTLTLSPGVDTVVLTVDDVEDLYGNAMSEPWTRELGWFSGTDTDEAVIYAVTDGGASVGYLPAWDPMPSGVGSEATLERLVFVSLFSDARIEDDEIPPDGTTDRRGWWADTDEDDNTGSRLWYLRGRAGVTAREYEDAIKSALTWMVKDRICTSVTATATIVRSQVAAEVTLTLVSGDVRRIAYPDLWSVANAA